MMDWTDRHCRALHRAISHQTLLYTEMVTAHAVRHGDRDRLLCFGETEHPVALQLGGSDPALLAEATRIANDYGYDEVNLNVGCPSDRVQSGAFGAVLMKDPDLVARCADAMIAASSVEITVKCRIGVDDQAPEEILPRFLRAVSDAGVRRVAIHARKAWLDGLSPKENRDIPPLDYPLVHRMKAEFPELHISINGGIGSLADALSHLDRGLDGAMIGRAAYHAPWDILGGADRQVFDMDPPARSPVQVVEAMIPYVDRHVAEGGRLHHVSRHMLGLFAGRPGARQWRRILSEGAHREDADSSLLRSALAYVDGNGDVDAEGEIKPAGGVRRTA